MTHFLQYWRPENAKRQFKRCEATGDFLVNHTAGEQLGKLQHGDVVWIITISEKHMYLIGRLEVDVVVNPREAARILQDHNLWGATYHAIAVPGSESKLTMVDITDIASELRFDGGTVDRLPRDYSGRNLQSVRTLSAVSTNLLEAAWVNSEKPKPSPEIEPIPRETTRKEERGAGSVRNAVKRRAVELHAMKVALSHFAKLGYSITDVSSNHPYDLECTKRGETLSVEVKGTQSDGSTVNLTVAEVRIARSETSRMALFLLHSIQVSHDGDTFRASGGCIRLLLPWVPADKHLEPTQYRYKVPI